MDDLDITIPIACFVVVLHTIIGGLIYLDNEEHHKYHDYQGIQGIMLCLFRICLFIGFMFGIVQTKREIKEKRKQSFMNFLAFSGSLYFLALPVFVGACQMVAVNQQ